MRTQKSLWISFLCTGLGLGAGCVNRNAYNPYPTQYPQQFQSYPYTGQVPQPGQPGQQIQPSPMIGQPPPGTIPGGMQPGVYQPGPMQPGFGAPAGGFAPTQQLPYYQTQPNTGYYGNQGAAPFLFGR